MQKISLQQFIDNQQFFIQEANAGKTFIYPTDTVYGIGGIYTDAMVNKIFAIKQRDEKKMFSIIAPSFDRIAKNCFYPSKGETEEEKIDIDELKMYLNTYHGVTYIFDYNKPGVRIIKHPFQSFVEALGEPFITTSCNLSGEPPLQTLENISSELTSQVDYIIEGGNLGGKASVLIDLIENKIIERN